MFQLPLALVMHPAIVPCPPGGTSRVDFENNRNSCYVVANPGMLVCYDGCPAATRCAHCKRRARGSQTQRLATCSLPYHRSRDTPCYGNVQQHQLTTNDQDLKYRTYPSMNCQPFWMRWMHRTRDRIAPFGTESLILSWRKSFRFSSMPLAWRCGRNKGENAGRQGGRVPDEKARKG